MATKKRSAGSKKSGAGPRTARTTKVAAGKKKAVRKASRKAVSPDAFQPVARRGGTASKSAKGKTSKAGQGGKESAGGFTFMPTPWAAVPGKGGKKKATALPFQPPKKGKKP